MEPLTKNKNQLQLCTRSNSTMESAPVCFVMRCKPASLHIKLSQLELVIMQNQFFGTDTVSPLQNLYMSGVDGAVIR